ncbi:hypothetical protein [Flavivirga eckloniae]|nr:hypothetical protein [Flavivirga eckloniae]
MKKFTSKIYARIRGISSLQKRKLTAEQIVLIFLALLLIGFKLFHGYKVYILVNEWNYVFELVSDIKISNFSYVADFMIAVYDSKTDIFKNNRLLKLTVTSFKKLPTFLLWSFVVLIGVAYVTVPDFNVWKYVFVAVQDYLIHKALNFLSHDKAHNDWDKCKSVFRYLFNLFKTDSNEKKR